MGSTVGKLLDLRTCISKLCHFTLYGDDSMSQEVFFESNEVVTVLLYLRISLTTNILHRPFRCEFSKNFLIVDKMRGEGDVHKLWSLAYR